MSPALSAPGGGPVEHTAKGRPHGRPFAVCSFYAMRCMCSAMRTAASPGYLAGFFTLLPKSRRPSARSGSYFTSTTRSFIGMIALSVM